MIEVRPLQYPPSEATLKDIALKFYRENRRKDYRELRQNGGLDEAIALKVEAAQRASQNLMTSGEWEHEAWNRAIRSEILESESD